jgi:ATP-binding cassette subfamily C protein LapB
VADFKASELPALVFAADGGDPLILLRRDGDSFECVQAGIRGSVKLELAALTADYAGVAYFVRPLVFFDTRSLLYHLPRPRRWFWDTLLANKAIYGWALLATVLTNVFAAVIPFYTMSVYDRVLPNNALDSLWVLTGAVVVVALFDLVVKMLRSYLLESAAARKADVPCRPTCSPRPCACAPPAARPRAGCWPTSCATSNRCANSSPRPPSPCSATCPSCCSSWF